MILRAMDDLKATGEQGIGSTSRITINKLVVKPSLPATSPTFSKNFSASLKSENSVKFAHFSVSASELYLDLNWVCTATAYG